jgi:hypothetical protein
MAKATAVALGLLLLIVSSLSTPAAASPEPLKWLPVDVPADGEKGDWGLDYSLYSSADGGHRWQALAEVTDDIVAIAIAPDDSAVYYATASRVYRSTDGAESFSPLPEGPGGAGDNNIEITSLDVAKDFTEPASNIIAVGTRDKDPGQFGGVYLLEPESPLAWSDTGVGSYDVYAVAFSPNYPDDGQLVAVVTDEVDTLVTAKIVDQGWGESTGDALLKRDNAEPVAVDNGAAIAFPDDYKGDSLAGGSLFIGIDAGGNGDVYRINWVAAPARSLAIDLNIGSADHIDNIDVSGLLASGQADSARLIAGAAASTDIYLSTDGGQNWEISNKPPTGEGQTHLLMANGLFYAATSGDESALSVSQDGLIWNQISLIDTTIEDIVDMAPSPDYSRDGRLFMLTFYTAGEHSLWRSLDGGDGWERVYSGALAEVDEIDRVALPPDYAEDNPVVFLAGLSNGKRRSGNQPITGRASSARPAASPLTAGQ